MVFLQISYRQLYRRVSEYPSKNNMMKRYTYPKTLMDAYVLLKQYRLAINLGQTQVNKCIAFSQEVIETAVRKVKL